MAAVLCGGLSALAQAQAAAGGWLWQIGLPDRNNAEFALAPRGYTQFKEDGFFVVGKSEAKRDWPYVHPGPDDGWAGGRPHTFSIVFGLREAVTQGTCKLRCDLLDSHGRSAPEMRVQVNGREFRKRIPTGAGDASVFGEPAKGKPSQFEIEFPATLLRAGANDISLTTLSGSWVLYDWLGLAAPDGARLSEVTGTVVSSVQSAPVLVERGGKLMQTVQFGLRHFGEETQATVRIGGATTNVTLRAAAQTLEVPVPAVETPTPVQVSVEVGGKRITTQSVTLQPVRKWVVYLLPHSHVDIGYTHVQTDVEKAQWKYLEMGMEAARKSATNPRIVESMVSFIIPAHNEERWLPGTLGAIFTAAREVGEPFEVIVVNDASTDRTVPVARGAGARVIDVDRRQIAAVRNAGARQAKGETLIFVDADTRVSPAVVRGAMRAMRRGAVGGGARVRFDGHGSVGMRILAAAFLGVWFACHWPAGCFIFCRREAFEAIGGFDERYFIGEELHLGQALKTQGRFVILSQWVLTSGRKSRQFSLRQLLSMSTPLLLRGPKAWRQRQGLEMWYGAGMREA